MRYSAVLDQKLLRAAHWPFVTAQIVGPENCSQIKPTQTEAKAHTRDFYTRPSLSATFLWHRGLQPLLQSLFNGSRRSIVLIQVYVSL